jgi:hypothetical protein
VTESDVNRAERFLTGRGAWAVPVGRMLPFVRAFTSIVAGLVRIPAARFGVLSLIGTVIYATALSVIGYELGSAWKSVSHGLSIVGYVLFVLVIAIVGFVLYRLRQFRREARQGGAEARQGGAASGEAASGGATSGGAGLGAGPSAGPGATPSAGGGRAGGGRAGGSHARPRSARPDAGVGVVPTPRPDSSDAEVG